MENRQVVRISVFSFTSSRQVYSISFSSIVRPNRHDLIRVGPTYGLPSDYRIASRTHVIYKYNSILKAGSKQVNYCGPVIFDIIR